MMAEPEIVPKASPVLDILVESPLWASEPAAKAILRRTLAVAAREASRKGGEIAIVLTDDSTIRALNHKWRGRDEATNVLSFPTTPTPIGQAAANLLGDIVIAFETAAREAKTEGKSFSHHLAHLAVHGYLHLLGHDHENESEAAAMEQLEVAILARLDVPDPYRAQLPHD